MVAAGALITVVLPLAVVALLSRGSSELWFTPYRGGEVLDDEGVYYQQGPADCGIAALAMFLESHGTGVDVDSLARVLEVTPQGTSLGSMLRVAREHGMEVDALRVPSGRLSALSVPALGIVDENHYALVERIGDGHAVVADPMFGRIRLSRGRLRTLWSGPALVPTRGELEDLFR